jgi:hypothetical protein
MLSHRQFMTSFYHNCGRGADLAQAPGDATTVERGQRGGLPCRTIGALSCRVRRLIGHLADTH